ncbi:MAG: DUF3011 domain-containing protein [Candidatus Acidiferrales bacterium]
MKTSSRVLAVWIFFLCIIGMPGSASAQRIGTYDLTCSSNDEQWHQCGTSFTNINNVELLRQISGSPCIKGQTWGFDARGVWVDRGCRAEFRVYGSGDRDHREDRDDRDKDRDRGDQDRDRDRPDQRVVAPVAIGWQSIVINCKSDDMGRHRCHVDGGVWRVRVEAQHSDSPCTVGQTWGYDDDEVWVDRGCRADFRVWIGGAGPGIGRSAIVRCKSDDERLNRCAVEGRIWNVQLERQNSGAPCVRGESWGFDENSIWVDRGCRADFRVWAGAEVRGRVAIMRCSSDDERLNRCAVGGDIIDVDLERQISGSPCIQGQTWGAEGNVIWVNRGCRADFRVWIGR